MKKIISSITIVIILVVTLTLTSCDNVKKIRLKTVKDGSIIMLRERSSKLKLYKIGDTILIYGTNENNWKIANGIRRKDEMDFNSGFYYYLNKEKTDSSYVYPYTSYYVNVIIEDIEE